MVFNSKPESIPVFQGVSVSAWAEKIGLACGLDYVVLFGSLAQNATRADSDVDFALVFPDGADMRRGLRLAHRVLWPRPFPVDLVPFRASDLEKASSALAREVSSKGIILYARH
jgi:predicted nucleotidyltransferase